MNLTSINKAVSKVCPIHGMLSATEPDFKPEATPQQRAAAQAIVDGWDWSAEAEAAREAAATRVDAVSGLTEKSKHAAAFRALAIVLNAELNALRTKVGLPTRTVPQAMAAFRQVLESGAAD